WIIFKVMPLFGILWPSSMIPTKVFYLRCVRGVRYGANNGVASIQKQMLSSGNNGLYQCCFAHLSWPDQDSHLSFKKFPSIYSFWFLEISIHKNKAFYRFNP